MRQFTYTFDQETRQLVVEGTAPFEVWAGIEHIYLRWLKRSADRLLNWFLSDEKIELRDGSIAVIVPQKADETDIAAFAGAVSMSHSHVAAVYRYLNGDRMLHEAHPILQLEMAALNT